MPTAALPVVLVRVPPPGGKGRHKLTKREAAGGLFFGLADRYGDAAFAAYRNAVGELRFVAEPSKGQVGDGPAAARAVAALQSAGFEVRAVDEEAATRLRAGSEVVGGVVADADAQLARVVAALAERGLVPRPYQLDGIRWVRATRAGALLDDMGLGKTMQILLAFGDRIVVFCPASVKGVWEREAAMWRPDLRPVVLDGVRSNAGTEPTCAAEIKGAAGVGDDGCAPGGRCLAPAAGFGRGKVSRARLIGDVQVVGGEGEGCTAPVVACRGVGVVVCEQTVVAPRLRTCAETSDGNRCAGSFRWPGPGEIVIVNYDVVTVDDVEAAGPCPRGVDGAADEGHVVKNARSNRAKAIRAVFGAIGKVDGRRLLVTATPVCNRPAELKAVLEAVGAFKTAFSSWTAFSKAFGGAIHSAEATPTAAATIALSRVSLRRTKAQVGGELPPVTFVTVPVQVTGQARELATAIEAQARPAVDAAVSAARARGEGVEATTAAIEAALSASSEIGAMSAARRVMAMAMYPAALEIVETCEAAGQIVLVISAHREVCERFGERPGWGLIAGGVSTAERDRLVVELQARRLKGMALTIRAGGVGLTLTAADVGVAVDLEWNPSLNEQAFARNDPMRRDRNDLEALHRPCTWYLLRGDTWIEDRVHELTTAKARMTNAVMSRVSELGGRVSAVPDLEAVVVGLPAPAPAPVGRPTRPGWIRDPALLARLERVATALPGGHVGRWLLRVAGEADGCLPPVVQGRGTRDLVDACERDAAAAERAAREAEAARLFDARPPATAAERHAAQAILALADADPDRAREQNGVGFAASTASAGHRLAAHLRTGVLTAEEWVEAVRIAAHHRAQVGSPLPLAA